MKGEGGALGWAGLQTPAPRPPGPRPRDHSARGGGGRFWWWWSSSWWCGDPPSVPPSNLNGQYIQISWGGGSAPNLPLPPPLFYIGLGPPKAPKSAKTENPIPIPIYTSGTIILDGGRSEKMCGGEAKRRGGRCWVLNGADCRDPNFVSALQLMAALLGEEITKDRSIDL